MKDSSCVEIVQDPVTEARRYVQNAKDILAGNTLWNGVLLMLNAVFHVKKKKNSRPHFIDYEKAIAQSDLCQDSIQLANVIIDRCAAMLPS